MRLPIVGRSGPRNGRARSRPRPITQSMWTGSEVNRSATDKDRSKPYGSLPRGKLNSSATAKRLQFAAMHESGSGATPKCLSALRTSHSGIKPDKFDTRKKMSRLTQMYDPAVCRKRFSSVRRLAVLHHCIRPLVGALIGSWPPWISARMRSH